jgi:hypothetical protein
VNGNVVRDVKPANEVGATVSQVVDIWLAVGLVPWKGIRGWIRRLREVLCFWISAESWWHKVYIVGSRTNFRK